MICDMSCTASLLWEETGRSSCFAGLFGVEVLGGGVGDFCGLVLGIGGSLLSKEVLSVETTFGGGLGLLAGAAGGFKPRVRGFGLGAGEGFDSDKSDAEGTF